MPDCERFLKDRVALHCGDCIDVLATLADNSIDSCVTDPPYHLTSIVKRFGGENAAPARPFKSNLARDDHNLQKPSNNGGGGTTSQYQRVSTGFMGKQWDGGDIAFRPDVWVQVLRVLKPGGHLLALGGTRTYHRMACAIEDAGFEIRDCVMWIYGSGFPKSHDVGNGWGTALKPAVEPIVLARKPLSEGTVAANVLKWGTGAINVDGCRIEGSPPVKPQPALRPGGKDSGYALGASTGRNGEISYAVGRWPANVIHDGSEEVVAAFPESGPASSGGVAGWQKNGYVGGKYEPIERTGYDDNGGSAARFFYTSKADADDRLGSKHPTVKPLDLMQYLVRLVTPPKGIVIDPFAGTGTTGEAAWREGMRAVLIEREAEYQADIRRRMAMALAGPDERSRESIKARGLPIDYGPLFGGIDGPITNGRTVAAGFEGEERRLREARMIDYGPLFALLEQ
jgi:site-specific DNA-methyltransferase (adenine-specific)